LFNKQTSKQANKRPTEQTNKQATNMSQEQNYAPAASGIPMMGFPPANYFDGSHWRENRSMDATGATAPCSHANPYPKDGAKPAPRTCPHMSRFGGCGYSHQPAGWAAWLENQQERKAQRMRASAVAPPAPKKGKKGKKHAKRERAPVTPKRTAASAPVPPPAPKKKAEMKEDEVDVSGLLDKIRSKDAYIAQLEERIGELVLKTVPRDLTAELDASDC
jgi:hypothetical protein